MRRKANAADELYISNNPKKTAEEISKELDLSIKAITPLLKPAKKKARLGKSKINLGDGQSVIQMTADIDTNKGYRRPAPTNDGDLKNGIFRGDN